MQTNTFSLQFFKGLDTKTDKSVQLDGSLSQLENAVFDKFGKLSKRCGFLPLTGRTNGGSISQGVALATYNQEVILFDGNNAYGYSPATETYINRGTPKSIEIAVKPIVRNNDQQTSPASAVAMGVGIHVREDSRGGVWYSISDLTTGGQIVGDTQLNASGVEPRAFALGNDFYVFVSNSSGEIKYYKVSALAPENGLTSLGNWATDLDGTKPRFDGVVIQDKLFLAYNYNSTDVKISSIDTNSNISSKATISSMNSGACIALWSDDNSRVWIGASDSARVKIACLSYTLTSVLVSTLLETIIDIYQMTGVVNGNTCSVYYERNSSFTYHHSVRVNTMTTAGTAGIAADWKLSVGLAGKAFKKNDINYLPLIHQSTLQCTFFVSDTSGKIVLRALSGECGSLPNKHFLPTPGEDNNKIYLPTTVKGSIKTENNIAFTLFGNSLIELDFDGQSTFLFANQDGNLFVSGGVINSYDGANFTEAGFNLYPENITYVSANNAGSMAEGDYQYAVAFEWLDAAGKLHRSAPSVAFAATVGTGDNVIELTIPTLRLTEKNNVIIGIYRTQLNGTIFYKVSSSALPLYNDPTTNYLTFEDTLADSAIESNELLYTTGELYNACPPPSKAICSWKSRVWVVSAEKPSTLYFSKKADPTTNKALAFSDAFLVPIPDVGGKIIDIVPMGDQLIIFKETAIYALSGEGPNAAGNNFDYSAPILITASNGMTAARAVVSWEGGLMWVGIGGIWNLSQNLAPEYIGAQVEEFNTLTMTGGARKPGTNLIIFTSLEGTSLVYDTFFKEWCVWTNMPAVDSVGLANDFYYLRADGSLHKQRNSTDSDAYLDGSQAYKLKWATGFYLPAGPGSYVQLHKLYLAGEFEGDHQLKVSLYKNYVESNPRTWDINATAINYAGDYGEEYYGQGPYGGYAFKYQYSFAINTKCESFKIACEDFDSTGKSYSITALRIEVGAMPGGNRIGKGKRA